MHDYNAGYYKGIKDERERIIKELRLSPKYYGKEDELVSKKEIRRVVLDDIG